MALKADRMIESTETGFYMNGTASPGVIACVNTSTSGASMDATTNVVVIAPNSSGQRPIGLLLDEVVNIDLTRIPENWNKAQCVSGDKVSLLRKGYVVTDAVVGTVNAGSGAMLVSSGSVANQTAITTWNQVANPKVGKFLSTADEGGFARLYVDL